MQEISFCFEEVIDKNIWADIVSSLPTFNTYSSWAWGEYKQRNGWSIQRISIYDPKIKESIGCFQLQKKKRGPITIFLIQGGIHLKDLSDNKYHEILEFFLNTYVINKRLTLIIVNPQTGNSQHLELGLLRSHFSPVLNQASYTYVLDNTNGALSGKTLSKNWRHNLKRAQNNQQMSIRWVENLSERTQAIDRLEKMYQNLTGRKSFTGAINFDLARDILIENEEFRIIEAWIGDEVIATRVGFFCNDHVLDFIAASTEAATKTYANYLLLWEMICKTQNMGKRYFDCGGINPAGNMGVYNFKKGLGGSLAVNGPLWVQASSVFVRRVARLLLSLKQ